MKHKVSRSFEYKTEYYDVMKKEYTLKNVITGEIKKMSKEDFDILYNEQYNNKKK